MNNKSEVIKPKFNKGIYGWVKSLLIALILAFLIKAILFAPYIIEGSSMSDTLLDGERVIVNKIAYDIQDYQSGDIIVFTHDKEHDYIKRVIGISGGIVEIKDNQLYVNEEKVIDPLLNIETEDFGPVLVQEDKLFVMGDNRYNSIDSRAFGAINKEDVIGKVDIVFWPIKNIRLLD